MDSSEPRRLYHRGFLAEAVSAARELKAGEIGYARGVMAGVQALMEMGKFREAAEFAGASAAQCGAAEGAALSVQAAYAAMMFQSDAAAREAVRAEVGRLAAYEDTFSAAVAKRWGTRLLGMEIALQVCPLTASQKAIGGFVKAAELFRAAGCFEEARGEWLRAADFAEKGPPANAGKAKELLERVRADAGEAKDLCDAARAELRLAELHFEEMMSGAANPEPAAVQAALASFDAVLEQYGRAGIAAGEAEVRAALGRKLMRYCERSGAEQLKRAAEVWEAAGHHGAADGAWRDLQMWHNHRADREEMEALEERLCAKPAIESSLTAVTASVQRTHAAFVRGDFAEAGEIFATAQDAATTPGQDVALLLMESATLLGRGARSEAAATAVKAVELLRPAAPCTSMGDALFQLGSCQSEAGETFRLWEEAAVADLACELNLSAAQRYANLAEMVSQAGPGSVLPDGRDAAALFAKAEEILGHGRDLESLVLRGNIAQRRGLVAFRAGDFAACGKYLTESENLLRPTERNADLAFTLAHEGLVLFQVARNKGALPAYRAALAQFGEAAERFKKQDLLGEVLRMNRLAGAGSWEAGNLSAGAEREELYAAASRHMTEAAAVMELLRRGRQEKELFVRQNSMDDIAAAMEPFLEEAFRFHLNILGRPDEALSWLEKGKTRGLLDAVAGSEVVFARPAELEPALASEEARLEAERKGVSGTGYAARKTWKQLTASLESLWRKMAEQPGSAAYGALRLGLPMDWGRWRRALQQESACAEAAGRAVVSVHFAWPRNANDSIRLIACRGDWDRPKTATVSVEAGRVETFLHQCFEGSGRSALSAWLKLAGGDGAWCQRFAPLIAPLAEWTAPGDIVVLIPQGPLLSVPLNALFLEGRPLAERNALCFAPSAAILMACWQRRRGGETSEQSAVIACPNPGAGFPSLRQADDEARKVGELLKAEPVISDRISMEDFRKMVSGARKVHFAGHATEEISGWESGLQIGGGEVFTARDFFQTRLAADLFTLSGCRTARSRRREGDEMLGLIPALLYAGASSVLASQWEAADGPTAVTMKNFYTALQSAGNRHASKADALRETVAAVRREFPSMPHWAAFTLHGDWK